jgi:hypothetical protein
MSIVMCGRWLALLPLRFVRKHESVSEVFKSPYLKWRPMKSCVLNFASYGC